MVLLRCSKCGSDAGFMIDTADRKTLEVKGKIPIERILKSVLVTCVYCNNRWDHVPVILTDSSIDEKVTASRDRELTH